MLRIPDLGGKLLHDVHNGSTCETPTVLTRRATGERRLFCAGLTVIVLSIAAFLTGSGILRTLALALGALGVVLIAAGLRRRTAGIKAAEQVSSRSESGADAFLASLRTESDIIASSFEEDGLLLMIVDQVENNSSTRAIRTIKRSLSCTWADAAILAREVGQVTRRLRAGARNGTRNES